METEDTLQPQEPKQENEELSHTDKIVGVISEPSNLFSKLVFLPTKATDWILPLLALIVVAIVSTFIYMSNPEIKYQMQQEQEKAMREQFDKMVESGQMSREQADEQMEQSAQFVNNPMFMYLIPSISVFVIMLLWFFIFTTLAFLLAKFALKGEGGYSQAMTAMGLPLYISVLGSIILVIAGMLMGKMLTGLNPATLMGMDLKTLPGFLLSRLDLFTIWFYVVVGISFAKMFKSDNVKKYVITSLAAWLIFMFIIFGLAQAVPQLGGMLR